MRILTQCTHYDKEIKSCKEFPKEKKIVKKKLLFKEKKKEVRKQHNKARVRMQGITKKLFVVS